jgi:hypothetical protein
VTVGAFAWIAFRVGSGALVGSPAFGMDYWYYRDLGARWLVDGSFFWPHQLAGSYQFTSMVDVVYPPPALLLFVPLAVLPWIVWWAVPAAVMAYALYRWRPGPWAIAAAAVLLAFPKSTWDVIGGNTDIWVAAGVAGGLLWGWPAALVALKPTLLPFALVGIRHRSWWLALGVGIALSLAMLPLWLDYVTAMRNVRGIDLAYSLEAVPLMAIPLLLWLGRSQQPQQDRPEVVHGVLQQAVALVRRQRHELRLR